MNSVKKCCKRVWTQLGKGCSENAYQRALELELMTLNYGTCREYYVNVMYKDGKGKEHCVSQMRVDLIVFDLNLIIECKNVAKLCEKDRNQCRKYKELSNCKLLLVNFGIHNLEIEEI